MKLLPLSMFVNTKNNTNRKGFVLIDSLIASALAFVFIVSITRVYSDTIGVSDYLHNKEIARIKAESLIGMVRMNMEERDNFIPDSSFVRIDELGRIVKNIVATVPFASMRGTSSVVVSERVYDWKNAYGNDTCDISDDVSPWNLVDTFLIGAGETISGIDILNGFIYVSMSEIGDSFPNLKILKFDNAGGLSFVSSIQTGIDIARKSADVLAIPGFVFLANKDRRYPLSIIDVSNPYNPFVIYHYSALPSGPITGYGYGNTLYYDKGFLYLGTEKSLAKELLVFDVKDPTSPVVIGSYETDTQINAITSKDNFLFLALPGAGQLTVLDSAIISSLQLLNSVTMPGYGVQDGKALAVIGNRLYVGRTVGGFDNINNHELMLYDISIPANPVLSWSLNIASSVNNLLVFGKKIFMAVGNSKSSFSIVNMSLSQPFVEQVFSQLSSVVDVDCEDDTIVVAQSNPSYLYVFKQ